MNAFLAKHKKLIMPVIGIIALYLQQSQSIELGLEEGQFIGIGTDEWPPLLIGIAVALGVYFPKNAK